MGRHEERLLPEEILLDQYLRRYKACLKSKKRLEKRRLEILKEFENPLCAVNYDGMPRGENTGVGSAAISYQLDEICTRLREQAERAASTLAEIMDIIDLLPENTTERSVIEQKYIDCRRWWEICEEEHLSRTPAMNYWRKGLHDLMQIEEVREIIKNSTKEYS